MPYLLLIALLLVGCASQHSTRPSAYEQARYECMRDTYPVVRPYVAHWPTSKANAYFRHVVNECIAMELTPLYVTGAALQGYGAGFQGVPFGAPNSIGPYGTLGPTWQSFNGFFQPQRTPQQQFNDMLLH